MTETFTCTKCYVTLGPDGFYWRKSGRRRLWCKECTRQARREFRAAESERINAGRRQSRASEDERVRRDRSLRHRHKIGLDEVEAILERQGGCGVCGTRELTTARFWHVDHDHTCCPNSQRSCGKCIRGILCHNCNLMLGQAKDDISRLMAAVAYLEASGVTS